MNSIRPSDLLLVPFAIDDCGDWFCVVAADCPEQGAVYFVDHEIEGDEAFLKIAASLDELIENAEPYVDTDDDDVDRTATIVYAKPGFLEFFKEQERQKQKKRKERKEAKKDGP